MTQSTILVAGTGEATSSDITVSQGSSAVVSLFTEDANGIPAGADAAIVYDTGTREVTIGSLNAFTPAQVIQAPGVFRVIRRSSGGGAAVGVKLEV